MLDVVEPAWTDQELEALRVTREVMTTEWPRWRGDVSDVYVWLEGEPGKAEIGVIFKHRDHPGCMFGSRSWPMDLLATSPADPHPTPTIIWANIDEDIATDGLPTDCKPGEVTWM